jgi:ribosomal protein S21
MITIDVKKSGGLDRALKTYKYKINKTGIINELHERQEFVKDSIKKRKLLIKAKFKEKKEQELN